MGLFEKKDGEGAKEGADETNGAPAGENTQENSTPDEEKPDSKEDEPDDKDKEPEQIETTDTASDVNAGLDKMSKAKGTNPFKLICCDEHGLETKAARVGNLGVIVSHGMGICFVPGAQIQTDGDYSRIA